MNFGVSTLILLFLLCGHENFVFPSLKILCKPVHTSLLSRLTSKPHQNQHKSIFSQSSPLGVIERKVKGHGILFSLMPSKYFHAHLFLCCHLGLLKATRISVPSQSPSPGVLVLPRPGNTTVMGYGYLLLLPW